MYSLLVPCYNSERFIDGFLANINKLNKAFDEVLFYDDASIDNTVAILQQKGCTVIKGEVNRGPGFARNSLASAAKGQWFHFHDIDDLLDPDYLTKTATAAQTGNSDVVLCNVDWYSTDQKTILLSWKYSDEQIKQNPVSYTIGHPIGGINGLYRKEKFTAAGGFDTSLRIWEDADLHVRLAGAGAKFCVIEEVLSISIRYSNSASADQTAGWLTRLGLLQAYQKQYTDKKVRDMVGRQAQLTASKLILSRQFDAAKSALKLSELSGLKVPDSKSPAWRILNTILPAWLRIKLRIAQLKFAFKNSPNG
ncbi:glycosyltransferase [Mucilaginibacter ginsenosidivorax]|uniref:Glycosyltransferase n=1 Tax=Mucilaginibacter ginsenosidivorax TaxID=862126 RepID=A0A5B8W2C1_9SPHI|nr:glycosyltransferase [Mucilaginibacter ginsenosidivorax]QEC77921.1 glycosyltransferase [Mucilaginibacter ginsenosidivorax]